MTPAVRSALVPDHLNSLGLTAVEVAAGLVVGRQPAVAPLPRVATHRHPISIIEDVIRDALTRPPCLVSFSGGRDSSAVLAVAVTLARREHLPLPIPASIRFPTSPGTDESDWQDLVIEYLRLDDQVRIRLGDELDAVGPIAATILRRHGLLWPFNVFFHAPLIELAAGGSLLTGVGGDELFFPIWPFGLAADVLNGTLRPSPQRLFRIACMFGAMAEPKRRRRSRAAGEFSFPWLSPDAQREFSSGMAAWNCAAPQRFDHAMREWWWPSRTLQLERRSFATIAADSDVQLLHPLCEPSVLAHMAASQGWRGFAGRTRAMRELFSDVLPEAVLARRTKAGFNEAFVSSHSKEFVGQWTGAGVDHELVNFDALKATLSSPAPDARALLLMQSAWILAQSPVNQR